MAYYNTTNLQGAELLCSQIKNYTQEQVIEQIFKENIGKPMTWKDVYQYFKNYKELPFGKHIGEVSLKRSITDLFNANKLIKSENTIISSNEFCPYPSSCHQYTMLKQGVNLELF